MKILLLNDNPVVNKLVTLSAQKTSDELEVVGSTDEVNEGSYDLLVVDDTLYEENLFSLLKEKITFKQSLYICSRDATAGDEFSKMIKKPFLPTDLVELFSTIGKEAQEDVSAEDIIELNELDELGDLDLEEELDLESEIDLADELDLDLDEDLDEELILDDELILGLDEEELSESILDKDDLQEVQDLLDLTDITDIETKEDTLDLDDDLGMNDLDLSEDDLDEELELTDDILDETLELDSLEEALKLEVEEEPEVSEELEIAEELELDDDDDDEEEVLSIESEIEQAVSELSDEELNSEIAEETLLEIATNEIDGLDTLNSRDLKIAIGEEVSEEEILKEDELDEVEEVEELDDLEVTSDNEGVESLKRLLSALSNKDVAASMKGMKITVTIELGEH